MAADLINKKIETFDYSEPSLIHQIPGVNREDQTLNYSHTSRFSNHYGDGENATSRLNLKAALSKDHAINSREWYEFGNQRGENLIREAFTDRDKKVLHWQRNLRQEIDNLTTAYQSATDCLRFILQTMERFDRIFGISEENTHLRLKIEPYNGPLDCINSSIEQEKTVDITSVNEMKRLKDQLMDYMSQINSIRNCLLSDAKAKSMNLTVSKSCQHSDILLRFPYAIEDRQKDQLIKFDNEQKWEDDVSDRVQASVELRTACANHCRDTENRIAVSNTKMANAWKRTENLFLEQIAKDEFNVYSLKQKLQTTLNDIMAAEQRLAAMMSDYDVQLRVQKLTGWRQQRLTHKPPSEHIEDQPVKSLGKEAENIENRMNLLRSDIQDTRKLITSLKDMKADQRKNLARLSNNLFLDRDSCLGLRKTVIVDGTDGKNV